MTDEKRIERRTFTTEFVLSPEVPIIYSDAVLIQVSDNGVMLSFFQNRPPIFVTHDDASKAEQMPSVCIARIILPPAAADRFFYGLKEHLEKSDQAKAENK